MPQRGLIISTLVLAFLWGSLAFAGVNMREGLWEITTKMKMEGMPMPMPARKHKQCLTEENMVKAMVPKEDEQQECKVTDQKVTGDTVTWTVKCTGKEAMEMRGKTTYHGDTFEGTMTMVSADPKREQMKMTVDISGRRIGDCK